LADLRLRNPWFTAATPICKVVARLQARRVTTSEEPVRHPGITGRILSVYFRDPDDDRIEVSTH
jgi:hypothetical protein